MAHFNHFDFLAPLYDRIIKPADPGKISWFLGLPIDGSLLDVGGGTGRTSYGLKDFVTNIIIADSSIGMLDQANEKRAFITVCSNSEQLPFKNRSFERVIMVDALHHVRDYRITIDEMWRVVMPGGRIVIEEPNIQKISVKFIALMEKLILMRSHFISLEKRKEIFCYPNASIRIECEGLTSWVIIEKQSG